MHDVLFYHSLHVSQPNELLRILVYFFMLFKLVIVLTKLVLNLYLQ